MELKSYRRTASIEDNKLPWVYLRASTKRLRVMGILDFLFGKSPKIFDAKGNIQHNLPKEKWEAWNKRYFSNPEMNWRNHSGTKAKSKKRLN